MTISGCNKSPTFNLDSGNILTETVTPIPIASDTLELTPNDIETREVIPSVTSTKQLTKTSQIANWVIRNMYLDEEITYVLDENLNPLITIPEYFFNAVIDPDTCNIIDVSDTVYQNINQSEGFSINHYNLTGELLDSEFILNSHNPLNTYDLKISPTLKWVAYKEILDWKYLYSVYDSKTQDVFVLPVNEMIEVEAIRLTEHSGAWPTSIAWSQNGVYLAFTDFDDDGIHQLYLFDTEKSEKKQLTNFDSNMTDAYIFDFQWGKNSDEIICVSGTAINNENQFLPTSNTLSLLNIKTGEVSEVYPETKGQTVEIIGLGNTGLLIVKEGNNKLIWYDTHWKQKVYQYENVEGVNPFLFSANAETIFLEDFPIQKYNVNDGFIKNVNIIEKLGVFQVMETFGHGNFFSCEIP